MVISYEIWRVQVVIHPMSTDRCSSWECYQIIIATIWSFIIWWPGVRKRNLVPTNFGPRHLRNQTSYTQGHYRTLIESHTLWIDWYHQCAPTMTGSAQNRLCRLLTSATGSYYPYLPIRVSFNLGCSIKQCWFLSIQKSTNEQHTGLFGSGIV